MGLFPTFAPSLPLSCSHPLSRSLSPYPRKHLTPRRPHRPIVCTAVSGYNGRQTASAQQDETTWRRNNAAIVDTAEKSGLGSAITMLHALCQKGDVATQNFNQVVSLLANKGRFEDGLELAEEAARRGLANIITFRPLMKRCCAQGDGKAAKRVWKVMTRHGIDGDMFLYAELMGALVRAQDMQAAQKIVATLVESGRRPHIVLYNTLLKGYARRANVKRGFATLKTIEEAGIKPDETVRLRKMLMLF